jgi:hypothetical protein
MQKLNLYRYTRENGGITTSLQKPTNTEYDIIYRLVADEGKVLTTDGENLTPCVDIEVADFPKWYETDEPIEVEEEPIEEEQL